MTATRLPPDQTLYYPQLGRQENSYYLRANSSRRHVGRGTSAHSQKPAWMPSVRNPQYVRSGTLPGDSPTPRQTSASGSGSNHSAPDWDVWDAIAFVRPKSGQPCANMRLWTALPTIQLPAPRYSIYPKPRHGWCGTQSMWTLILFFILFPQELLTGTDGFSTEGEHVVFRCTPLHLEHTWEWVADETGCHKPSTSHPSQPQPARWPGKPANPEPYSGVLTTMPA